MFENNPGSAGEDVEKVFPWSLKRKTVKTLRRNQGLTANELATMAKLDTIRILRVDDLKLKDVPQPLQSRIKPFLDSSRRKRIPR